MVSEAVRTNGMYFGAIYYHGKTTVTTGRMFQILYFSSSRGFAQSGPKALRAVMNTVGGGGGGGGGLHLDMQNDTLVALILTFGSDVWGA